MGFVRGRHLPKGDEHDQGQEADKSTPQEREAPLGARENDWPKIRGTFHARIRLGRKHQAGDTWLDFASRGHESTFRQPLS
jgi:hypothetical protein